MPMLKRSSVVSNLAASQPVSARLAATDHSAIFFTLLLVTYWNVGSLSLPPCSSSCYNQTRSNTKSTSGLIHWVVEPRQWRMYPLDLLVSGSNIFLQTTTNHLIGRSMSREMSQSAYHKGYSPLHKSKKHGEDIVSFYHTESRWLQAG